VRRVIEVRATTAGEKMRSLIFMLFLTTAAYAEEPIYRAQKDTHLLRSPFISVERHLIIEFYAHGMYRLDSVAGGKELAHGAYNLFSDVLVLDPDTEKKMTCRYSVNHNEELHLEDCNYAGWWESTFHKSRIN
jgi:hypothetical protein